MPNQFTPITFERSFASHEKSKFWHPKKNGDLMPINVSLNSNKKCWFKCDKCNHDFDVALYHINQRGRWCPYCAGQKLCGVIDCNFCFNKSFASHEKSKFWHPKKNGDLMPINVSLNSQKKCWFKCDKCNHDFDVALNGINQRGRWCPICKNKTEKKLFEFLVNEYPNMVKHNIKYNWCKNPDTNCHFPYDFEVFEKIIIELDGDQHIDREVSNWGSLEEHQERDIYKMEQAINNGKHIIRILQRDVWNDKNDWKEKLKQEILLLKDDVDTKIRCIGDCDVYREYTIE